ncbi:MAG: YdcF family protein [Clostridia bacterium]|nr:YdcF family protein [Clostridia bacterium]
MTREKRKVYIEKKKIYRQKRRIRLRKKLWRKNINVFAVCAVASVLSLALFVLLATGIINAVVVGTTAGNICEFTAADGYETAVVFGAKVHEGGTLSHMLKDRMDTAIELYREGKVKKLLVSGDGRGQWSETKYMRLYAMENGVAEADIIEDGEGFSTIETVTRAKELFGVTKCVLVTQKYHLYRAIYAAESMDMDVRGASADVRTYYGQFYRDVREIMARVKDFALCIVK